MSRRFVLMLRAASAASIALAIAACSVNPPKPARCDGSARRPLNGASAAEHSAAPSRSCAAVARFDATAPVRA